ncbi:MAG: DUF2839 domain-containing protein [Pseudanabaenaceae cyanobacterium]
MGDAKRRKEVLGESYGRSEPVFSWLPGWTKDQAARFVALSTRGAWLGIFGLVAFWVTVRFVGPAFGWWQLVD